MADSKGPDFEHRPGMADEVLRDLAPLLAAQGIDVRSSTPVDLATLQKAMADAVERHNFELFSPVGEDRALAADVLQEAVEALLSGDFGYAADLLDDVPPESPHGYTPTVAGCIGVALGLLDDWLSGQLAAAPSNLRKEISLPSGGDHVTKQAAIDILALAAKGRAFRSVNQLIMSHGGGGNILFGSTLALAGATGAWSRHSGKPPDELTLEIIR
jgi:hypothetical protein